ncbi:hypothetical protein [Amycolatopsis sp. NPDC004079]|uniref:hypothetical protein n=1 Tax=Amycolatopsis sp. NPDC004079 TaxID=3154549 RepID=UPI0033BF476A
MSQTTTATVPEQADARRPVKPREEFAECGLADDIFRYRPLHAWMAAQQPQQPPQWPEHDPDPAPAPWQRTRVVRA